MKIFISIASYQDPLLGTTIRSAYNNSDNPKSLIFGVCDQSSKPIDIDSFNFKEQIRYEHINPVDSKGPCWARSKIQKSFNDEEYYLQIDSHMQFEKGWDTYLIKYIHKIIEVDSSIHQLPIITCYPRSFEIKNFEKNEFELNSSDINTHTIAYREDSMFMKNNYSRQIGSIASTNISHGYLIAAGFLFSTKEFVKQIPYDPEFYFYGEELSIMLRAFTRNFGIFHLPAVPIFHLYRDIVEVKRKLHWDESEDSNREIKWHQREEKSINKLNDLINNKIDGIFGLGDKRTLKDYEYISGVDLVNKKVIDKEKAFTGNFISSLPWDRAIF
tara:strand:- start:217 stop:1203 length:987 start_codon:yes stop_codon:yes gene_type:complete